jgi:hypothetical protein
MDSFFNALGDFLSSVSLQFFFEDPQRVRSNLYIFFGFIFLASLVTGGVLAVADRRLSKGNRLHRTLLHRYGSWLGWLGGVGLLVLAIRYADIQLFSKRIWTVLDLFAILAVIIHYVWYRVRRYPDDLALYREEERRSRHLPPAQRGRIMARALQRRPRSTPNSNVAIKPRP